MKKAAAKRKRIFLLVAVCLLSTLLLVPTAEASRNLPKPLTPQLTPPATPAQILQDSDAKPEPRYRIFGDLSLPERPLGLVEAQKTASGVFTLGIQSNVWQTGGLEQNRSGPSFQGLWADPVTGIAYARNRWYDARTASWLSEDPMGSVDSPNLYAFVGWGPHVYTDPYGNCLFGIGGTCSEWSDWLDAGVDQGFELFMGDFGTDPDDPFLKRHAKTREEHRLAFEAFKGTYGAVLRLGDSAEAVAELPDDAHWEDKAIAYSGVAGDVGEGILTGVGIRVSVSKIFRVPKKVSGATAVADDLGEPIVTKAGSSDNEPLVFRFVDDAGDAVVFDSRGTGSVYQDPSTGRWIERPAGAPRGEIPRSKLHAEARTPINEAEAARTYQEIYDKGRSSSEAEELWEALVDLIEREIQKKKQ